MGIEILRKLSLALGLTLVLASCGSHGKSADKAIETSRSHPVLSFTAPDQSLDLRNYTLTGQYSLPVGTGSNLLAAEVSAVTYNWDTDTLFVVGDGGTAIVQIDKRGNLINAMPLPADPRKAQRAYYRDTEGLAYVGGGQFALIEERYRQVNLLTYTPNTMLNPATVKTVKLGTTVKNIGFEGISFDRASGEYLLVKEKKPIGLFQTAIDFDRASASNGSPSTENSTNLFDPALIAVPNVGAVTDLADLYALSNVLPATAPDFQHMLVLSEEAGQVLKMDRQGRVLSTRYVEIAPLHAQIEGISLDKDLNLYLTTEQGTTGVAGNPQLWVYAPTRSAQAVGVESNLYLTFEENISAGSGHIELRASSGETLTLPVTDAAQVHINGRTVTLNPAQALTEGQTYTIAFAAGVFKNQQGALPAAADALTFTTIIRRPSPRVISK